MSRILTDYNRDDTLKLVMKGVNDMIEKVIAELISLGATRKQAQSILRKGVGALLIFVSAGIIALDQSENPSQLIDNIKKISKK